jgi:hypothetical protein
MIINTTKLFYEKVVNYGQNIEKQRLKLKQIETCREIIYLLTELTDSYKNTTERHLTFAAQVSSASDECYAGNMLYSELSK